MSESLIVTTSIIIYYLRRVNDQMTLIIVVEGQHDVVLSYDRRDTSDNRTLRYYTHPIKTYLLVHFNKTFITTSVSYC